MLKPYEESVLRNNFLIDALLHAKEAGYPREVYTFEMLQALRDMAERGVYPDGRFSDQDCNVWSMFRNFRNKEERD